MFVVADVIDLVFKCWFNVAKCRVDNLGLGLFGGSEESDIGEEAVVIHCIWLGEGQSYFPEKKQSVLKNLERMNYEDPKKSFV